MNLGIQDAFNLGWKLARRRTTSVSPVCSTATTLSGARSSPMQSAP